MKPVLVAPLPPVKAITLATAGSLLITPTICLMELSMAGKDESCGPCTPPVIAPVSCCGKKPFGIVITSTTLRAIVRNRSEEHTRATRPREGQGRSLGSLSPAGNRSGVLLREKAFRYRDNQHHIESYRQK